MKTRKQPSDELAQKMDRVRDTASKLRDNHLTWIVGAASEHFAKAIAKCEANIARHERFKDEPLLQRYSAEHHTRMEAVESERAYLEQYRDILRFLHACDSMISHASAEQWADEMIKSGFGLGRRKP